MGHDGQKKIPYARVPIPTIKTLLHLSDRDRRLFLALLVCADFKSGRCVKSRKGLAEMINSNPAKISSSSKALARAGLIAVTRQGIRRPNMYRLTLPRFDPPDVTETAPSETLDSTESATSKPPYVTETAPHDDAETVTEKINTSTSIQKNISIAEKIYETYSGLIRSGARADAVRSIGKLLKNGLTAEALMACIQRYASNGMPEETRYRIQANNFFGVKERYKEYLGPADGKGMPTGHLSAFMRAKKAEEKDHGRES